MDASGALDRGREAFETSAWASAYTELIAADGESPLDPEDVERLAVAAYLIGEEDASADLWVRAHHDWMRLGSEVRAARCAFWLALGFLLRGAVAQYGGWLARMRRLFADGDEERPEQNYVSALAAVEGMFRGDPDAGVAFEKVIRSGEGGDPDVVALARLGRGQALIRHGRPAEGMATLDEVMVTVTAGEVSPILVGIAYCAVLLECQATFDVWRAREWTVALSRWCERQPDLVPYRGQCLVHRSQVLQLQGAWEKAIVEAREACDRLAGRAAAGLAFYQLGELHRLRGALGEAEEAFRQASRLGRTPQPGLALLRLAQGEVAAAASVLRAALDEAGETTTRSQLLETYVEILLAADDLPAARSAAEELAGIAADSDSPLLHAVSAQAIGAVCLAEGNAEAARLALRTAWQTWSELDAPYGAARARVLLARADRRLGDEASAAMELDAAAWVFRQLGAEPDAQQAERLAQSTSTGATGQLSVREREVLALVAAGRTNRQIAHELLISEHTVRRHLQNIFVKIDVPSRAAATAFALRHRLI